LGSRRVEMPQTTNTVCPRCGNSFEDADRTTVAGGGFSTITEHGSTFADGDGGGTFEMQPYLIHVRCAYIGELGGMNVRD
jgi:hypothetical protein